jgi:hypothetical protein
MVHNGQLDSGSAEVPEMLANLVQAARLTVPDYLPAFFGEQGRALGAEDVVLIPGRP